MISGTEGGRAGFCAGVVEVGVGRWVGVAVGTDVPVGVPVGPGAGDAYVAVAMPVAVGVAGWRWTICGAIHRALSSTGDPRAETLRTNFTFIPAKGLRSISALEYNPS